MSDTPQRYGPVALGAAPATILTVPAGTIFTARNIHVANESGSDARFTISIGVDGAGTRIYRNVLIEGDGGTFDWSGYMPIMAGEVVQASSNIAGVLTVTISGVDTV